MEFKKFAYLFFAMVIVSCGSAKPKVRTVANSKPVIGRTKKTTVSKPTTVVVKNQSSSVVENNVTEELVATSKVSTTMDDVQLYINQFKDVAKGNMKEHGVPASITLAQGVLESGAGKGRLSTIANNHFGIKCHTGWTGDSVSHDDDAAQECFRKYNDPSESYRDHSLFLTSRSRYNNLFKLDKGDYEAWAKGLKAAGYATDPKYPDKLIGIIERYNLYKYDNEVLSRDFVPAKKQINISSEEGYVIQQGDTLYSLSKKFNLTVAELKALNNLSDNAISIGQIIKIK